MPTFLWPGFLWGVIALPLLVLLYFHLLRRRARYPVVFSTTTVLAAAAAPSWRRHLGLALFLTGLAALIVTLARPVAPLSVPADRSAIMLAIDISGSMRSADIYPTRLDAAKSAAETFVNAVPDRVRIGLVAFAGFAELLSPPINDHRHLNELIAGLGTARRTAIGEGLLEAVAALPGRARPTPDGTLPPPSGPLPPAIVVLLSDGRSNTGIDPLQAAEIARLQEVRVYTVGMGQRVTPDNAWTIGGPMDEDTLQAIATVAGGTYHHASTAQALHMIYKTLAAQIGWERRPIEISAATAGVALLLLIAASVISLVVVHPLRA